MNNIIVLLWSIPHDIPSAGLPWQFPQGMLEWTSLNSKHLYLAKFRSLAKSSTFKMLHLKPLQTQKVKGPLWEHLGLAMYIQLFLLSPWVVIKHDRTTAVRSPHHRFIRVVHGIAIFPLRFHWAVVFDRKMREGWKWKKANWSWMWS